MKLRYQEANRSWYLYTWDRTEWTMGMVRRNAKGYFFRDFRQGPSGQTYHGTRRQALAVGRKSARIVDRTLHVDRSTKEVAEFISRVFTLSNARKVRRAHQTAEIRHIWRKFTCPVIVNLRSHRHQTEIMEWLEQRDLHERVHLDIPYVVCRKYRRPVRIHGDVIDFRNTDENFEFKVRWL
ncbi:MAG: hypothetical protein EOO77_26505 [Oxalobacteraceae bacterium]|nr:MAG: hypothetical protein EOO77_26505 [Oxalobacteraceae bacterium]